MKPAVIFENVTKKYTLGKIGRGNLRDDIASFFGKKEKFPTNNQTILATDNVSFTLEKGKVLGIIGNNGAGKSTLLKLLCKITSPTSGKVTVNSKISSLLELGTGFHPDMTGRENIFLNASILGMSEKQTRQRLDEIIAFSEIEDFIDTPVKRYSSGMYARLAFSVAVHLDSEILILDEILSVGDFEFQKKSSDKIQEMVKTGGKTTVIVSHNMKLIQELATETMLLRKGKMLDYGKTEKVISEYLDGGHLPEIQEFKNLVVSDSGVIVNYFKFKQFGENTGNLQQGERFQVEFALHNAVKESHEVLFQIEFKNAFGQSVAFFGNRFQSHKIDLKPFENKLVIITAEEVFLPEGNYSVEIKFYTEKTIGAGKPPGIFENMPISISKASSDYFENPERDWRIFPQDSLQGYARIRGVDIYSHSWE